MFRILLNLSFVYSVLAQSRFDVANSERSTVECQCGQVTVALPIRAYNRYTVIPESPTSASSPTLPTSPPSLHPKVDRFITNVSSILRELKTSKSACMTPKMATSDVMNVALMRVRTTLDEAYDDMRTSIAMMVSTASDTIFPRDTLDREFLRNEIQSVKEHHTAEQRNFRGAIKDSLKELLAALPTRQLDQSASSTEESSTEQAQGLGSGNGSGGKAG